MQIFSVRVFKVLTFISVNHVGVFIHTLLGDCIKTSPQFQHNSIQSSNSLSVPMSNNTTDLIFT